MCISSDLQKAIDTLKIEDVYLREQTARCVNDFEPKFENFDTLTFQTRYYVKQSNLVELGEDYNLLRVFVDFGARWIDLDCEDDEIGLKAYIEALFVAEYRLQEDFDRACIDAFALQNVSYHVWPYWREFLQNQCTRMHLPRVIMPTIQLAQNSVPKGKG